MGCKQTGHVPDLALQRLLVMIKFNRLLPYLRVHALAVVIMGALVLGMYLLSGGDEKPAPLGATDIPGIEIQITSASYGMNCLERRNYYSSALDDPFRKPGDNLDPLRHNNVIYSVSKLCNGKSVCEFVVNNEVLGTNPDPRCAKNLHVEYRCYSYDRPWMADAMEGGRISLNCNDHVR